MSAPSSKSKTPAEVRQETLETIRELTAAAGETDDMGGGVPIKRLVDEVDSTRGAVKGYLTTLREEGKVKKVNGRCETYVRPSYLPVDEADTGESRDRELRADGGTVSSESEGERLTSWTCRNGHQCGAYDLICHTCRRQRDTERDR